MHIEIINKEAEIAVAVTYDAVDFANIVEIMNEGYQKLWAYVAECGKEVANAPYCKYSNGTEDYMKFDIELGMPVHEPLPEKDDIYMSKTCEGKAIVAMHKGAYKDIEETYTPLMQYLSENNLLSTGIYYDYYLNDPATTPESELLTRVVFPIE